MKKALFIFAVAMCSVLMMAQTNQVTWVNGRAVLGQSISSIDSIKYGTIEKSQKLELWLPETIIVHDTIHDTVYIRICDKAPEGVEMVDLGLPSGIKWANMNVGASSVTDYGDYFAWGETEPYYSSQDPLTWKTGKENGYKWQSYCGLTRFVEWSTPPYDATTKILTPEYDAASQNWKGAWRMPTKAEQDELMNTDNCTWEWKTNYNGTNVNGYLVTSTKNGNSIFLPASGYRFGASLYNVGSYGYFWSSSLNESQSDYAFYLYYFGSVSVNLDGRFRYFGQSVRPVCQ